MLPLDALQVAQEVLAAAQSSNNNPYETLLLPRNATFQEARSAYKRLFFLHPDKNPGNELASEAFKCLTDAFERIKTSQEQALQGAQPQQISRKWSAFTGDAVARPGAAAAEVRQPAEAHLPQPPRAASKWGRPSADAMRMLKIPEPAAARPHSHKKPAVSKSKGTHSGSRMQSKSTAPPQPKADPPGEEQGISGQEFYGTRTLKRHRPLENLNIDTEDASIDGRKSQPLQEQSQWASKKAAALSDVLRSAVPLASGTAVHYRRKNPRAIDCSDDDDVSWEDSSSGSEAECEAERVEGEVETAAEIPSHDASDGRDSTPYAQNSKSERSRNLLQSLVAGEAAAKITASLGAAAAASKQRRMHAMQRLFQRKGSKRGPKTWTDVA